MFSFPSSSLHLAFPFSASSPLSRSRAIGPAPVAYCGTCAALPLVSKPNFNVVVSILTWSVLCFPNLMICSYAEGSYMRYAQRKLLQVQ